MNKLLTAIFTLISFCSNAQALRGKNDKEPKTFVNQGAQENYWAKKIFVEEYSPQTYTKFSGTILVKDKSTIEFDNKTLIFWTIDAEYVKIFTDGIFYPQLLLGDTENIPEKSKLELDSLSAGERLMYIFKKNDTLKISEFEELRFLSKTPKVRRFRFWGYTPGFMNPKVYFIELTNKKAGKNTDISTFIKGAKLTFIKAGWIVI